jgi:hypothetical protein
VIAKEFEDPVDRADLASIVGERATDDGTLARWIDELCQAHLETTATGAHFATKSVGAVFGLALGDGGAAVLKLFPPHAPQHELAAIDRCHRAFIGAGFPAPRPLTPLFETDGLHGVFLEFVQGDRLDAHVPDVRRTLAAALAELARLAVDLDPTDLPLGPARGEELWPRPHRIGFTYELSGGEWIDARARAAQAVIARAAQPVIVAHADWGTKNAIFGDGRIRAMLDWDSLVRASEPEMVGRAAAQFTAQWEFPAPLTPSPAEATAFVREYEQARGRRFDPGERRVANAAADYLMAQVARQASSFDGDDHPYQRLLRETADSPLIEAS